MFDSERPGVGGCLDENFAFKPSAAAGTVIYLNVAERLDRTLALVELAGGCSAQLKTTLPDGMGFVAHIVDSEGNRVGFHAMS